MNLGLQIGKKNWEVVLEMGLGQLSRIVEAETEKEARQKAWEGLEDCVKDKVSDIEVFEIEEN